MTISLWWAIGMSFGTFVAGFFLAAICAAAKKADEASEAWRKAKSWP